MDTRSALDISLARHAGHVDYLAADGCWIWRGKVCNWGYGVLSFRGKFVPAHRFMYEALVGPIPEGLVIDHTCRNRLCLNPAHLQAITHGENAALGKLRRTHCPKGHEWTEENTRRDTVTGYRECRACISVSNRKQHLKRKAAV